MHGGDIYRNQISLDFSVNVNPCGVPEAVRSALRESLLTVEHYPDIRCMELKQGLSEHFGVACENVLVGNGASELLYAVCRWKNPRSALLAGPGFSGYERALRAAGCSVKTSLLDEAENFAFGEKFIKDAAESGADIIFLSNPSNPVGTLVDRAYLERLLQICEGNGTTLVVDECFMELTKDPEKYSLTNGDYLAKYRNLLILRAFTKSFALPGVRLGYLLCGDEQTAEEIALQLPEWNVSGIAQRAGVAALACEDYLNVSRALIETERAFLMQELKNLGYKVYPSAANYILFRALGENGEKNVPEVNAEDVNTRDSNTDSAIPENKRGRLGKLYWKLIGCGILIRDCSDYAGLSKGFYRVAVRTREENLRLLLALQALQEREL